MGFLSFASALLLALTVQESFQAGPAFWNFDHHDREVTDYSGRRCSSNRTQSPINITKRLVPTFTEPLTFSDDYCKVAKRIDVHSDGHSIVLKFVDIDPELSSGPLNGNYKLHSVHFHWGQDDYSGSEHTINGIAYPMEMHVVHTKDGVDLPTAQQDPSGISVIGYFFEIKPMEYTKAMRSITKSLLRLTSPTSKTTIDNKFPLSDLVMPFHDGYISYNGSLTTPPYSEAVVWILSPYTIKITPEQMDVFRSLTAAGVVNEEENFRETQPLCGRKVHYNFLANAPATVCGCSAVNSYWFENIFSSLLISKY